MTAALTTAKALAGLAASVLLAQAPAAPAQVKASTEAASAPLTVDKIYTAARLRDPFMKGGGGAGGALKPFAPEDFSIHNLTLVGLMKDRGSDYALFNDNAFGVSFILRKGRLYDSKNKPVARVTGSLNVKQKAAHLMTEDGDVQMFQLGGEEETN